MKADVFFHEIKCRISILVFILLFSSPSLFSQVKVHRYVDQSRSVSGNGKAWNTAYKTLKEALLEAHTDHSITDIHVAKGTYYPTGNQSGTDRTETFGIYRDNLAIRGGYPSGGVGERNWAANPTILSGEINNSSVATDNSYHVMVIAGIETASDEVLVEGFRIQWGRADGSGNKDYNGSTVRHNGGGGIAIYDNENAYIRVRNCVISGNYASDVGAGVFIENSSPSFGSCLINGNYANYCGGILVYSDNSKKSLAIIVNTTIAGNYANHDAGGVRISGSGSNSVIFNSIIYGNSNESVTLVSRGEYAATNSLVQGVTVTHNDDKLSNNLPSNTNPMFVNHIAPRSGVVHAEGDYHLQANSPCIDKGENAALGFGIGGDADLDHSRRVVCEVDLGPYEIPKHPVIHNQPTLDAICPGNASMSIGASNVDRYEWQVHTPGGNQRDFTSLVDGDNYEGVTTSKLTLKNVTYEDRGKIYRCVVWKGPCANTISEEVVLKVKPPTLITEQPINATICAQTGTSFTVNASYATGYQWQYDDGSGFKDVPAESPYDGTTSAKLQISSASSQMNNYNYRVVVSGECAPTVTSISAKLTVKPLTLIIEQPTNATTCAETGTSFTVNASYATSYQWQYNDGSGYKDVPAEGPYEGTTSSTLQIISASSQLENYSYRVVVSGECSSITSSPVDLKVQYTSSIAPQTFCNESPTVTNLLALGTNLKWYSAASGGTALGVSTLLSTRTYYVTEDKGVCETPRLAVAIVVRNTPAPSGNPNQLVAKGKKISDLVVNGSSLKWFDASVDGNVLPSSTELENKDYYVSQTLNGCESVRLAIRVRVFSDGIAYVKQGATGSGVSWEDASGDLQAMINLSLINQVWVGKGVYLPQYRAGNGDTDRDRAFILRKGVKVYGGFAGTETLLSERDLSKKENASTLSGDFNQNDQVSGGGSSLAITGNSENAFHVVVAAGNMEGAELNGFRISGGNANGSAATQVNDKTIAKNVGGGLVVTGTGSSHLTLQHIIFQGNTAKDGGGIYNFLSRSTFSNVLITQNTAINGGGIYNMDSWPTMTYVTLAENENVIYNVYSYPSINNSIIWGNNGGIVNLYSVPTYSYSLVQDHSTRGTNINTDPLFADAANGDYRLKPCSPAINAGDPASTDGLDLDEQPRLQHGRVDMGAYEYQGAEIKNTPPAFGTQTLCKENATVADLLPLGNNLKWYTSETGGTVLDASTSLRYTIYYMSEDHGVCETPRIAVFIIPNINSPNLFSTQLAVAGQKLSDLVEDGSRLRWYDALVDGNELASSTELENKDYYVSQTVNGCESTRRAVRVHISLSGIAYVKQGATGSGVSWEDASGDLQTMINVPGIQQVWVGKGIYIPKHIAGNGYTDRDKAFVLRQGVKVYGGFAGTENLLRDRDLSNKSNASILSGDFNQDDQISGTGNTLEITGNTENAYHVVVIAGDMEGAELNGFTITGGNATGGNSTILVNGQSVPRYDGGGLALKRTRNSKISLEHLVIRGNNATYGGGIQNWTSSPYLSNVVLSQNIAQDKAGGMENFDGSYPTLINVTLAGNRSGNGGSIFNYPDSYVLLIKNSILWGNSGNEQFTTTSLTYNLIQGFPASGTNLSTDPLFVDAANGDYRLQPCSPAINAGDPASTGGLDLDGYPRVQHGRVDIGAYEASSIAGSQIEIVANGNMSAAAYQQRSGITWYASGCNNLVVTVTSMGEQPVEGMTDTRVWVGSTPGFVGRRYEIVPENNPTQATGRITLYFTQSEFTEYNQEGKPHLPTGPSDQIGIANLRIEKRGGQSSDATGDPSTYNGTVQIIDPKDEDIVWNASLARWEVSFDVVGFSGFFAYAVDNAALPVTLLNFDAKQEQHNVVLTWQTTEEINVSHYEVERSNDAKNWVSILSLNAEIPGDGTRNYGITDTGALHGLNYYRLRMVDLDMSYSYSMIVSVDLSSNVNDLHVNVYPNPATSDLVTLEIDNIVEADISFFNVQGLSVEKQIRDRTANKMQFDVSNLPGGIYLIRVKKGNQITVKNFMVIR